MLNRQPHPCWVSRALFGVVLSTLVVSVPELAAEEKVSRKRGGTSIAAVGDILQAQDPKNDTAIDDDMLALSQMLALTKPDTADIAEFFNGKGFRYKREREDLLSSTWLAMRAGRDAIPFSAPLARNAVL